MKSSERLCLLLFDIDGTLVRATRVAEQAIERTFRDLFSLSITVKGIERKGRSDPVILRELGTEVLRRPIREDELFSLLELYGEYVEEFLLDEESDYFHVLEGVHTLCHELTVLPSILLGIQSGNIKPAAMAKLRRGGIEHYFVCGGYGSDSESRAEMQRIATRRARQLFPGRAFPPSDVFVIGDGQNDIRAALENQYQAIGVASGKTSSTELESAGAHLVLPHLGELEQLISFIEQS